MASWWRKWMSRFSRSKTTEPSGAERRESIRYGINLDTSCRLLAMDFISLGAVEHLDEGFAAHRELLFGVDRRSVLIAEDVHLAHLTAAPRRIVVAPLRMAGSDGAPVTIVAEV